MSEKEQVHVVMTNMGLLRVFRNAFDAIEYATKTAESMGYFKKRTGVWEGPDNKFVKVDYGYLE